MSHSRRPKPRLPPKSTFEPAFVLLHEEKLKCFTHSTHREGHTRKQSDGVSRAVHASERRAARPCRKAVPQHRAARPCRNVVLQGRAALPPRNAIPQRRGTACARIEATYSRKKLCSATPCCNAVPQRRAATPCRNAVPKNRAERVVPELCPSCARAGRCPKAVIFNHDGNDNP